MAKTKSADPVLQRAESVTMIPTGDVHPATDNPRRQLGDLTELTESIKSVGILQPLVVVADGETFKVVVGHRRRAAGELAELRWLPCIVRSYDDQQRQVAMLIENLHREDLTPLEEAAGYQQLVDQGLSQRQIAEQVGRSQAHVSKHLGLLQLPEKAREAVDSGRISKEDGFELTQLAEHPEAIELAIQRAGSYGGVGRAAVEIVAGLESAAARKATRERLEKEGKRIIGEAAASFYGGPNYPGALMTDLVRRASKKFDPVAHEKLGCHGYFILWDGEAIAACSDSHKHQPPSRVHTDPEVDRRMKEAEKLRAKLEQLRGRREKHIQLLLSGKLGADARDHVVRQAIFIFEPEWNLAAEWLGIDLDNDAGEGFDSMVARWVAEAPSVRQLQAALAVVLEVGERVMRYVHPKAEDGDLAAIKGHLEFLSFSGLELAPEEAHFLTGPVDVGAGEPAPISPASDEAAPSTSAPSTERAEQPSEGIGGQPAPSVEVGDFEEEDLPGADPAESASQRMERERRIRIDAAKRQLEEVAPRPRDPKACRECGCHGDCKGGCSWIDVDEVKGLLCSNHELVLA